MRQRLSQIVDDFGGVMVLCAVLLVVAGTWGFIELLDEVREGQTQQFDEWAIRRLAQYHDHPWANEIGRDLTAMGGVTVLAIVTAAVLGYLWQVRRFDVMWLVILATGGGLALSTLLKYFIDRPRPDLVPHLSHVYTTSFPSGHSMMAAVVYLTLGSLLARVVAQRATKIYFIVVAMVITFLVGVSRVFMGVHWPTDVLAGWSAGLVWAILCWLLARWLQRQHVMNSEGLDQR